MSDFAIFYRPAEGASLRLVTIVEGRGEDEAAAALEESFNCGEGEYLAACLDSAIVRHLRVESRMEVSA
jgi:hypothetical protein